MLVFVPSYELYIKSPEEKSSNYRNIMEDDTVESILSAKSEKHSKTEQSNTVDLVDETFYNQLQSEDFAILNQELLDNIFADNVEKSVMNASIITGYIYDGPYTSQVIIANNSNMEVISLYSYWLNIKNFDGGFAYFY